MYFVCKVTNEVLYIIFYIVWFNESKNMVKSNLKSFSFV